ncbi:hypothetical protein A3O05_11700 [Mycobacteroides abscessus]|nr:hypothetical protein A3O05_11700 [Mycobacteroides abscessus]
MIMVRACATPLARSFAREVDRPRPVDRVGQVAIPSTLLASVGLGAGSLVSFSLGSRAIKVFSADRVVAPLPAARRSS